MALRRKQEEKNLALLRELAAQQHNKQCLDCGQRGPTYVNMTIGSFVCTSCSGRLRGLTPPHRVKSISMASFSAEEIEFIKQRGNEWCKAVWLGLFDPSRHPEMDAKDDQQIKDFMAGKYEKKRYYVDPSVAFKERPSGGQGSPPVSTSATATPTTSASAVVEPLPAVRPLSKLAGAPVKPITLNQNVSLPGPTRPSERTNIDLLADLSPVTASAQADPFSPSGGGRPVTGTDANAAAQPAPAAAAAANFANFANFDALNASAPAAGSGGGFANFSSSAALSAVPISAAAAASAAPPPASGDRYAALKELDEVLKAEVEPKVDWGAAHREAAASQVPAWSAFGPVTNGTGPYGASPQQHGFAAAAAPQQQQQVYGASPLRPQLSGFPAASQFAAPATNGFTSEMGVPGFGMSNGTSAVRPGVWGSPGQQTPGWGAAPPSANPFMSSNGAAQPVNPHNPFL